MPVAPPMTMWVRSIGSDVSGVKNTFSSWDNCMSKAYCKWPVIIAIVIVSLIVISIITCLARCLCCGAECCCACFKCCNACCPSPRGGGNKRSNHADEPQRPGEYGGGYQSQAPPIYAPPLNSFNQPSNGFNPQQNPKFATFDAGSKKVNADALPPMPSWQTAQSRKVLDDSPEEEVEMDHFNPADEQKAPMLAHQAPPPNSIHDDQSMGGAAAPYQDLGARNGGDLGNPYGQAGTPYGQNGTQELYGPNAAVGQHGAASPYGRPALPQHQSYGASSYGAGRPELPHQQSYGGHSYGAPAPAVMDQRSPASGPYGQDLQRQQSYGQTSYGVADHNPMSPPQVAYSPPQQAFRTTSPTAQQPYRTMSPPAQNAGVPSSLMPARGATPQAPQQSGYQSYSPHRQQQQSESLSAYAPSGSTRFEPSH